MRHAARTILPRERYEDVVLRTRPALYVPMQGGRTIELVRQVALTVTNATRQATGPFGGASSINFDGTNDTLVLASNAAYHPGDTFSVGGWFNMLGLGAGTGGIMITADTSDYTIYVNSTSHKLALRKSGASDVFLTDRLFQSPFTDGWTHVIMAKNAGSSVTCWLNGVTVTGTFSNATIVAGSADLNFGEAGSGTNDYQGRLAHWAMWSRVLTQAEVSAIYTAGKDAT